MILTDIRMPDLDGRALYEEIERRWPGRTGRVVFVTGDTLASALREFVSASGRPVIEKPFLPSEVRRVVARDGGRERRGARIVITHFPRVRLRPTRGDGMRATNETSPGSPRNHPATASR